MFGCKQSAWPSTHNSPVWCYLLILMGLEWLLQNNPKHFCISSAWLQSHVSICISSPWQRSLCSHGTPRSWRAAFCLQPCKKATWDLASLSSGVMNQMSSYRSKVSYRMGLLHRMGKWLQVNTHTHLQVDVWMALMCYSHSNRASSCPVFSYLSSAHTTAEVAVWICHFIGW